MTQKRRNLIKKFSKLLLVEFLSASLIFSPMAFAVTTEKNDWVQSTSSVLNQITGTIMSYQGMASNAQQRMGLNQALQINVRYDSMFNCPMAEAISKFPEGYCQTPIQMNELEVTKWIGNKAADRLDFYNELLSEVQQPPVGLQCMKLGTKSQADDFQRKINQLQAFKSQIKEEDEQFKRMLTEKKDGMKALYGELYGQAAGTGNLSEATNNYVEAFKNITGCTSVMTTAKLGTEGRSGGLSAIREFMDKPGSGGKSVIDRTYAINDGTIEKDLNAQIAKLKAKIQKDGIDNFSSTNYKGSTTAFSKMGNILAEKSQEINDKKDELQKLLSEVGSSRQVPTLDENFSERIAIMEKEATTTFKDQIIQGCVDNPIYNGISADDIINGIQMKGGGGATLKNFKREFAERFKDQNLSLQKRLDAIETLSQEFGSIELYVKSGNRHFRPHQILQNIVDNCKKKYDDGTLKADEQDTYKRKIELISKSASDIKMMESTFTGDLSQKIKDEILNCTDSQTESVGGCSESALDPSSNDNFCLKSAQSCAAQINSCMANVDNMIKDRTTKLNQAALSYNNLVQQHINKRKQQLAQSAQYAFLNADWLTNFFKGSTIETPVLGIKMPEKALDTDLQLSLFGSGNMSFLDDPSNPSNLISQLDKLEQSLTKQQENIQGQMQAHIAKEKANLNAEKQKWQNLIDECDSAVANYDQMVQQQYTQTMEQQQESLAKADSFCRKYNRLRNAGPGPGCEDDVEDLAGDMDAVISALDGSVNNNLGTMQSICRQVNSEQSDLEYDDDISSLASLCKSEGDEDAIMTMVEKNINSYVPGLDLENAEDALESDDYTVNQKRAIRHYVNMMDDIKTMKERDSYENLKKTHDDYSKITTGVNPTALIESNKTDICNIMNNKIIIEAIEQSCKDKDECDGGAVNDNITTFKSDKNHPEGYNSIGNKAKDLLSLSVSPSWSDYGEEPEGNCFSQNDSSRMEQNSYNPASSIPGLENLGGSISN